eukprot:CAMPEP_0181417942 /NCGR_PEP_ID=MMETSP1110-20121109/11301_1 /TAXON_ID=174948 /ORGANISM="Symbiodinium sp., Strain CCMP421" /LENGTH=64 /DNA_ID=CAMNT_0023540909 /DNA_START=248 /DNA_END=442 /DNA_ORIENTATION=+
MPPPICQPVTCFSPAAVACEAAAAQPHDIHAAGTWTPPLAQQQQQRKLLLPQPRHYRADHFVAH